MKVIVNNEDNWVDGCVSLTYEELSNKYIHLWLASCPREKLILFIDSTSQLKEAMQILPYFDTTEINVVEECEGLEELLAIVRPDLKSQLRRQKMKGKPLMELINKEEQK